MHLIKKLFKELKNGIEVLVGQAVFKLQIKTVKMLFLDQKLKNRLAYLNFDAVFEFFGQFYFKMHKLLFKKMLIILR